MKFKEEKGITGIDITISVILISVFLAIILTVSTNLQKNENSLEHETQALYYAIDTIEEIKVQSFAILPEAGGTGKIPETITAQNSKLKDGYIGNEPYYRTIIVKDYSEMEGNSDKKPEIIKKVTVEVDYMDGQKNKKIVLSTIKTKEE